MRRRRLLTALGTAVGAVLIGAGPVAGAPEVTDATRTAAPDEQPEVVPGGGNDSLSERPPGADAEAGETGRDGRAVAAPGDWWPLSIMAAVALCVGGLVVVGRIGRSL